MPLGPRLVIPGSILGIAVFIFFTLAISTAPVQATGVTVAASTTQPIARAAPAEQAGSCNLGGSFPEDIQRWCDTIIQFASEYELPPELVAAVIWQESGGDPEAYSKSGAVGLMQVMPRDGIASGFMCINGPCFAERPSIQELLDPIYNIEYGTKMLARLIGRHGDFREALKSYGPKDMGYSYADRVMNLYQRALEIP